jgi:hypothetical protein
MKWDWRPITEAPKDASIIAVDARSGFQRVVIWIGCAWSLNGTDGVFYAPDYFTDWMPLPDPPQEPKS